MKLPDEPRERTRVCIRVAVLSTAVASLVSGSAIALNQEWHAGPVLAVNAFLLVSLFAGMAGSAYAVLQIPLPLWSRVGAAVAAFVFSYFLGGALSMMFAWVLATVLGDLKA